MPDRKALSVIQEGALGRLLFCSLAASGVLCPALASPTDCPTFEASEIRTVAHVTDGDTVIFENGERLRILGINTPELGHGRQPDEPGAVEARDFLETLLVDDSHQVMVRQGKVKRDRHGRQLGYLFNPRGDDLGAALVSAGLAFGIAIPPNLEHVDCYSGLEHQARIRGSGIWSSWRIVDLATEQSARSLRGGFRLVVGTLETNGASANAYLLDGIHIVFPKLSRPYFAAGQLDALVGKRVLFRGWVIESHDGFRLLLHHASMLTPEFQH